MVFSPIIRTPLPTSVKGKASSDSKLLKAKVAFEQPTNFQIPANVLENLKDFCETPATYRMGTRPFYP